MGQNMILVLLFLSKIAIAQEYIEESTEPADQISSEFTSTGLDNYEYVNNSVFEYHFHDNGQAPVLSYVHQYRLNNKPSISIPGSWTGHNVYNDKVENQFLPGQFIAQHRLGFGPRRRKRSALNTPKIITNAFKHLMEMPLFCWKIYVNCLAYPKHICCPVLPDKSTKPIRRRKPRKIRAATFDIPMVEAVEASKRSDTYKTTHELQEWKPYSPYYIGLDGHDEPKGKNSTNFSCLHNEIRTFCFLDPPVLVRRCMTTDMSLCQKDPQNPCCNQFLVNRFYPIGPYIQPSLTENWVSALFEYSGKNPVAFMWIKTLTLMASVVLLTLAWGYLGMHVGLIPKVSDEDKVDKRMMDDSIFQIEEGLIQSLEKYKEKYKTFHCCTSKDESLRCIPKTRLYKSKIKSMNCLYDGYDLELNQMVKLKRMNK